MSGGRKAQDGSAMPGAVDGPGMAAGPGAGNLTRERLAVPVEWEALAPRNWLTYRGNHQETVGRVMGPGWDRRVSTVVAAVYEPDHQWPDGRKGRTLLGCVKDDARPIMGDRIVATHKDGRIVTMVRQVS